MVGGSEHQGQQAEFLRLGADEIPEVEEAVGNVDGEDRVAVAQVVLIEGERLAGEQVNRYRVTGKGVHHENVEIAGMPGAEFPFERKARIARHDLGGGVGIGEVGEDRFGSGRVADDGGVDFVEPDEVACFPEGRHGPGAQA